MKLTNIDIIIVVNSPGELSAYAKPTIQSLRKFIKKARITLVFTPCPYATGREMEVASKFSGVSQMIHPKEFITWMIMGKLPKRVKFGKRGVVLFLGGDLLYGGLISKRLNYKAIAYTASHSKWQRFYEKFLIPDRRVYKTFLKRGVKKEKLKIIGDLMVDSTPEKIKKTECIKKLGLNPKKPIISFLPGSREFQTNYLVPFFLKVASIIKDHNPEAQFIFSLSPYMTTKIIQKSFSKGNHLIKEGRGLKGKIKKIRNKEYLIAEDRTTILLNRNSNFEAVSASDIAITIPGTNTAEIASLGIPMIVVFPLDQPEVIPLEGILEPLSKIPQLGKALKRALAKIMDIRVEFFALPNIKAKRKIVPEIRGKVKPEKVAKIALSMLKNKRKLNKMSNALKKVMGKRGASQRIAKEIINLCQ